MLWIYRECEQRAAEAKGQKKKQECVQKLTRNKNYHVWNFLVYIVFRPPSPIPEVYCICFCKHSLIKLTENAIRHIVYLHRNIRQIDRRCCRQIDWKFRFATLTSARLFLIFAAPLFFSILLFAWILPFFSWTHHVAAFSLVAPTARRPFLISCQEDGSYHNNHGGVFRWSKEAALGWLRPDSKRCPPIFSFLPPSILSPLKNEEEGDLIRSVKRSLEAPRWNFVALNRSFW